MRIVKDVYPVVPFFSWKAKEREEGTGELLTITERSCLIELILFPAVVAASGGENYV